MRIRKGACAFGMIQLKRVYDAPAKQDGVRILVERLWPRGLSKAKAAVDLWLKDIAPSPELRTWYGHEVAKWAEFRKRYRAELAEKGDVLTLLKHRVKLGPVTFVYAAHDEQHNSAVVLKEYLEKKM